MNNFINLLFSKSITEIFSLLFILTLMILAFLFVLSKLKIKKIGSIEFGNRDFATKDDFIKIDEDVKILKDESEKADRITLNAIYVILDCLRGEKINGNVTNMQKDIFDYLNQ
ncbi:MAG: hypothetical protein ACRC4W_04705 [Treponemataceae bacterium]